MKKIYVVSPYAGEVEKNVANALGYCKYVMSFGYMPLAAHLYFTQMTDDNVPEERRLGLNMGLELLAMCDEAWVFYDNYISAGMAGEIAKAKELGIAIKYFVVRDGQILGNIKAVAG
ncbi:MAG: hypothetical protein MJ050_06025 [Phascolarctobacterium sp.]|nr:hypothetical protein [Phascolarctobacterium sp.]